MNPVWKLNCFLFNIEGYGEFFSGITPRIKATEVWLVATSAGHLKYWRYGKTREFRVKLNFAPKNSPTFYPELLFDCIYCIYVIQWYIESCKMLFIWKKVDVQKKKKREQHRVLSTSTCDCHRYLWTGPYVAPFFFFFFFRRLIPSLYILFSLKTHIFFFFSFWTSTFFHINNILQLSMYHCMTYIQ
jgi:hypothetical protein